MNKEMMGESWFNQLQQELEQPYFQNIKEQLRNEYSTYKIYPKPIEIFKAFQLTPFEKTRVVILGQDPYPFGNHAHGLAFSSQQQDTPASLKVILREVDRDIVKTKTLEEFKKAFPTNDLTNWAKQGVLLLNTSLTVRAGEPLSHNHIEWNKFVTKVLQLLWLDKSPKVFVLWGKEAQNTLKNVITDETNHHKILTAGHPATASKGKDKFSGCNHFSKINYWFWRQNLPEINWTTNAI